MNNSLTFENELKKLPPGFRGEILYALSQGPVIPSALAAKIIEAGDLDIGNLMIILLPIAASFARVPISKFNVGAVSLGMPEATDNSDPGSLYLGSNIEFVGQALSFGVHGEQSAINNAWLHGEAGIQALAINSAPCGYCRQFLYELNTANQGFNVLLKKNPKDKHDTSYTMQPLDYFLPNAFGPRDLGLEGGFMDKKNHQLSISVSDSLAIAALKAANMSYAPYTNNIAGVAIRADDGAIYTGCYAENAAYNPSMSPLESALALMNMSIQEQAPYKIEAVALVETESKSSQKGASEAVLESVAPDVQLNYYIAS